MSDESTSSTQAPGDGAGEGREQGGHGAPAARKAAIGQYTVITYWGYMDVSVVAKPDGTLEQGGSENDYWALYNFVDDHISRPESIVVEGSAGGAHVFLRVNTRSGATPWLYLKPPGEAVPPRGPNTGRFAITTPCGDLEITVNEFRLDQATSDKIAQFLGDIMNGVVPPFVVDVGFNDDYYYLYYGMSGTDDKAAFPLHYLGP